MEIANGSLCAHNKYTRPLAMAVPKAKEKQDDRRLVPSMARKVLSLESCAMLTGGALVEQ
jgi:hypothetical protein